MTRPTRSEYQIHRLLRETPRRVPVRARPTRWRRLMARVRGWMGR